MKNGITSIISCRSSLPISGAFSGSVETRTGTLPSPHLRNDARDASADPDDQSRLVCFSGEAILSQIKLMNDLPKKIERRVRSLARCLVGGPTADGSTSPVCERTAGLWHDDILDSGYATALEEFSDTFLDSTTESVSGRTVEARTSTLQENAASHDPPRLASMSFEAALAPIKSRNSEIHASGTAVDSCTGILPEKEASLSYKAAVAEVKARNLSLLRSTDVQRPLTEECVGSNSRICSDAGSSLNKCSAGGGNDSRKYSRRYPGRYSVSGSVDLQRHSSCATSTDSRRNPSFTVSDLPRDESTGGNLNSGRSSIQARHSSLTVADLPRHESTSVQPDSRRAPTQARHSSLTVSGLPRQESTSGQSDSPRSPTHARRSSFTNSEFRRYDSTGGKLHPRRSITPPADSRRSYSTYGETSDARRYSTGARDVPFRTSSKKSPLLSPVHCVRSLLNPATSMETFLSIVCTEETLVATYDSRVQLSAQKPQRSLSETLVRTYDSRVQPGAQKTKRSSSEILLRRGLSPTRVMTSTENLDWSIIRTAPESQGSYSNSNISWSNPLDEELPLKDEPPKKEEPHPSTSEPSQPTDHFAIYVGSERKKLFISSQVFDHELFKQLLNSDHYKLEKRDGNSAIVLTCDIDYFQRLLFFVDQRPRGVGWPDSSSSLSPYPPSDMMSLRMTPTLAELKPQVDQT